MNSSVRWVSAAVLALLATASFALAADAPTDSAATAPPSIAPAPDAAPPAPAAAPAVAPAAKPAPAAPQVGDRAGFGGIGLQMGLGDVLGSGDYSKDAQLRMSISAQWRYAMSRSWRWQISPGFVWAGYSKRSNPAPFTDLNFPTDPYKDDYLSLIAPISTQLQYVIRGRSLVWHIGAGPGAYRVWVQNHRKVVRDPVSLKLHRGMYLGGTGEIGVERFFKGLEATSLEITLDAHYVNAKRNDQFPSGFNDTALAAGLRIGGNYYFNLRAPTKKSGALPGLSK